MTKLSTWFAAHASLIVIGVAAVTFFFPTPSPAPGTALAARFWPAGLQEKTVNNHPILRHPVFVGGNG